MLKRSHLVVIAVLLIGAAACGEGISAKANIISYLPSDGVGLAFPKLPKQTITVGGANADIPGFTNKAIQIAIDALKVRGGGTVKLMGGDV